MTGKYDSILAKHEDDGGMPLSTHLKCVADAAMVIARHTGQDEELARKGAILHDIGCHFEILNRMTFFRIGNLVPECCFLIRDDHIT